MVSFDCVVPDPVTSRPRRRSEQFDFLKAVDRSTTIVMPRTVIVTFGQLPDRVDTGPSKSTVFGPGIGGGGGGGGGGGVGAGVGDGAGGRGLGTGSGTGGGAAAWVTAYRWPAMFISPTLAAPELGATSSRTVPLAFPLCPDETTIQFAALVAFHVQPLMVLTSTASRPPAAAIASLAWLNVNRHGAAA
jgi:hypothetical protein